MIGMKEEEVKDKWCPLTLTGSYQNCIGSGCMAWRTVSQDGGRYLGWTNGQYETVSETIDTSECSGKTEIAVLWYETHAEEPVDAQIDAGYCGLAGKTY